tara:strand:- start:204 stop:479 length:276 start_codon:yes stop_codon:yes gene_type:complete
MTNTPEKIWVLPLWGTEYPQDCRVTYEKELFENDSQEYIRKDISDARIEELEEAFEAGYDKALQDAASLCEGTGAFADEMSKYILALKENN